MSYRQSYLSTFFDRGYQRPERSRGQHFKATRTRRAGCITVLLMATLWTLVDANTAAAHNGEIEFVGDAGPFFVEVVDEQLPDGTFLYTLMLRDLERGLPVDDAILTVAATLRTKSFGPETASRFANAYQVILPFPDAESWTVQVSISHPDFEPVMFSHGLQGPEIAPWWTSRPILVGVWLLPVAGAIVLFRSWTSKPET